MIKIFINEEEVVSDKNLNIEEELLSASSVILNNCYPKSWENDKDYTSKFYYPKDYSKCKILDGTFENGTKQYITKSVSGLNPNFETNVEAPLQSLTLYGKCEQASTTGKNLFDVNQIVIGSVANGKIVTSCPFRFASNYIDVKPNTNYSFHAYDIGNFKGMRIGVHELNDETFIKDNGWREVKNNVYSLKTSSNTNKIIFVGSFSETSENVTTGGTEYTGNLNLKQVKGFLKFEMEQGSNVTGYEPYTGGEPSPNPDYPQEIKSISGDVKVNVTGKNLLVYPYFESTKTLSGITYTDNVTVYPQIERGIVSTKYEPYQSNSITIDLQGNELCSGNDIKDELVIENGSAKIVKKIKGVVINGTDVKARIKKATGVSGSYLIGIDSPNVDYTSNILLSDRFLYKTREYLYNNAVTGISLGSANGYWGTGFAIQYSFFNDKTIDEINNWFASNNTSVYYILETPEEIDLGPISLPNTHLGQNNIIVDSNLTTTVDVSYLYKNYDLLFAGVVKNSGEISLNPRYPHYCSLQILDFKTFLSEGETLNFVISNKTINEAIDLVISTIADYGFIKGDINIFGADDIIGAYSTQNKTPYDFFQYIANITGSIWTTTLVDENQVSINFYDPTKLPRGINLEYNTDFFEKNKIRDLSFSYGSRDYRNKQVMESSEVYANVDYNEIILADGVSTTFSTSSKIATLKNIKVNGVQKTFTTKANKDIGIDADFYYSPGSEQIESEDLYTLNTQIEITYTPLVKGRQIVYNYDEITRIKQQIGRKGIIARYENRNDILSSDELDKVGQSYIRYKGSAEVILTLIVEDNDIYNIGQIIYFDSPIDDLAQDYMIKKKNTQIIATIGKKFYTYELTSSFNSEKAINYFDNQRSKASGNIAEGESITRNIDLESNANIIFYGASASEIEVANNNILDSILDCPFIE